MSDKAGRELDALIAERIFGWTYQPANDGRVITGLWHEPNGNRHLSTGVRAYSTDIAAAWMVVEHMRRKGWLIDIQPSREDEDYVVYAWPAGSEHAPLLWIKDVAAPVAICRAALAALDRPNET